MRMMRAIPALLALLLLLSCGGGEKLSQSEWEHYQEIRAETQTFLRELYTTTLDRVLKGLPVDSTAVMGKYTDLFTPRNVQLLRRAEAELADTLAQQQLVRLRRFLTRMALDQLRLKAASSLAEQGSDVLESYLSSRDSLLHVYGYKSSLDYALFEVEVDSASLRACCERVLGATDSLVPELREIQGAAGHPRPLSQKDTQANMSAALGIDSTLAARIAIVTDFVNSRCLLVPDLAPIRVTIIAPVEANAEGLALVARRFGRACFYGTAESRDFIDIFLPDEAAASAFAFLAEIIWATNGHYASAENRRVAAADLTLQLREYAARLRFELGRADAGAASVQELVKLQTRATGKSIGDRDAIESLLSEDLSTSVKRFQGLQIALALSQDSAAIDHFQQTIEGHRTAASLRSGFNLEPCPVDLIEELMRP